MAKVEINRSLIKEIMRKFSSNEANTILDLLESLETSPNKGKIVGVVGAITIKELKYKKYRFYCVYDGYSFRAVKEDELVDLLFRFVKMSEKRNQQDVINQIKSVLQTIGPKGL